MISVVRKPLSLLRRLSRQVAQSQRRLWFKATQTNLSLGTGVQFGKDCVVRCSNARQVSLGDHVTLADRARVQCKYGEVRIGAHSFIGIGTILAARDAVTIGRHCQIAEYVTIRDNDHKFWTGEPIAQSGYDTAPIVIGDNVWIGAGARILKGVTIGDDAVVAAGAVVTGDVSPRTLVAGVPARVIRRDD